MPIDQASLRKRIEQSNECAKRIAAILEEHTPDPKIRTEILVMVMADELRSAFPNDAVRQITVVKSVPEMLGLMLLIRGVEDRRK